MKEKNIEIAKESEVSSIPDSNQLEKEENNNQISGVIEEVVDEENDQQEDFEEEI